MSHVFKSCLQSEGTTSTLQSQLSAAHVRLAEQDEQNQERISRSEAAAEEASSRADSLEVKVAHLEGAVAADKEKLCSLSAVQQVRAMSDMAYNPHTVHQGLTFVENTYSQLAGSSV